jgi:hypothetical protein
MLFSAECWNKILNLAIGIFLAYSCIFVYIISKLVLFLFLWWNPEGKQKSRTAYVNNEPKLNK